MRTCILQGKIKDGSVDRDESLILAQLIPGKTKETTKEKWWSLTGFTK